MAKWKIITASSSRIPVIEADRVIDCNTCYRFVNGPEEKPGETVAIVPAHSVLAVIMQK
jgi:hypothetical protein